MSAQPPECQLDVEVELQWHRQFCWMRLKEKWYRPQRNSDQPENLQQARRLQREAEAKLLNPHVHLHAKHQLGIGCIGCKWCAALNDEMPHQ